MHSSQTPRGDKVTVAVFGHYGHENLGDEAITEAVIHNVHIRWPTAKIIGLTMDPPDTETRYRIDAFPIRRQRSGPQQRAAHPEGGQPAQQGNARDFGKQEPSKLYFRLKRIESLRAMVNAARFLVRLPGKVGRELVFLARSYGVARQFDFLLICGSNQFFDSFGGPWGFPYTVLKWSVLARLAGARVVHLSVGAGPIDSALSRVMIRLSLPLADYTSLRDYGSRQVIESIGYRGTCHVCPDLAHSLPFTRVPLKRTDGRPVVGINPMPVYDRRYWFLTDDGQYRNYVAKLATFSSNLLRRDYPIFLFPTQTLDNDVIQDVIDALDDDVREKWERYGTVKDCRTVSELMAVIASADIVVPTRFHGVLLSLQSGRPTLGVCYHPKTRELLAGMGQGEFAVDFERFSAEELWGRFCALEAVRYKAAQTIEEKGATYRAVLVQQYDNVLALLRAS